MLLYRSIMLYCISNCIYFSHHNFYIDILYVNYLPHVSAFRPSSMRIHRIIIITIIRHYHHHYHHHHHHHHNRRCEKKLFINFLIYVTFIGHIRQISNRRHIYNCIFINNTSHEKCMYIFYVSS
jgi:hypothetical protein